MAATLLLVLATVGAGVAGANLLSGPATIVVDQRGAGDTTTITAAVATAEDGDRILIRPGTYEEAVVLDKDVDIAGEGPRAAIVWKAPDGSPQNRDAGAYDWRYALKLDHVAATVLGITFEGADSAVHVAGGDAVLTELTFSGVGRPHTIEHGWGQFPDAVNIYDRAVASVTDSSIQGGGPISAYEDTVAVIEGNALQSGPSIGLHSPADGSVVRGNSVTGARVRAIGVVGPNRALIEGNMIQGSGADGIMVGIGTEPGNDAIVRGNVISGAFTGIVTTEGAGPEIVGNTLDGNELGLWVSKGSDQLTAMGNTFTGNDIGIRLLGGSGLVEDNSVAGGETGIQLVWDAEPTLTDNTVEGAGVVGLSIDSSSTGTVTDNDICGNAVNLDVDSAVEATIRASNEICEDAAAE